ncbi:MAG: tRNA lysidine(34) synthetase TilS [Oscillospiraceae bacterium]|jgi:tRNA(Ile)-lysidine synthase|nr:tRNA lysidine(34) synthetase TilS [Oscillospiraceae bacterium]
MYALLKKVERCMERHRMLSGEKLIYVAVSGGADSMCLLDLMLRLAPNFGFTVTVLHFNHKLRGAASDADEQFVRTYCGGRGISLIAGSSGAPLKRGENAAREARYTFFAQYAESVAVAHTADDNAETMLMRLARGSGVSGLAGISPVALRGGLKIIRPIICLTRAEVLAYLEHNGIPHIEDESNGDTRFTRNRVRADIVPILREINPKTAEHALALAEDLRSYDDYITRQAETFLTSEGFTADNPRFGRKAFGELHPALASKVLTLAANAMGIGLYREHINEVLKLSSANKGGWTLEFPNSVKLVCERNFLVFTIS